MSKRLDGTRKRLCRQFWSPKKGKFGRYPEAVAKFHEGKRWHPIVRRVKEEVKGRKVVKNVLTRVVYKHPAQ